MEEGKRQKQVGALLLQELSDIFQRLGLGMIEGGLVSLTSVKVTPDLLEARVYLSLFQVKDATAAMKVVENKSWEIKKELASRVKHQLRRIPIMQYFQDDTLDHADKMEALFKKINAEKPAGEQDSGDAGGQAAGRTEEQGGDR
jgi:ribosome-binding factor A